MRHPAALLLPGLLLLTAALRAFDCDGDGDDDTVGVGSGTDCDGNGWPDACDLARRFALKGTVFEASEVNSLEHADLDSDGDPDLAVSGPPGETYLLWSDGKGAFPSMSVISSSSGSNVLLGDLENDGDTDLFIPAPGSLLVRVNQGNAVFLEGNPVHLEGRAPLLLGDLDADGDLDLVAGAAPPAAELVAHLQVEAGLFGGPRVLLDGLAARSALLEDLDGDGRKNDVAVLGAFDVTVLRNPGTLPFAASGEYRVGSDALALLAGDVEADGDTDLVTVNSAPGSLPRNISVLSNAGDGAFALPRNYAASLTPASARLVDLDGDLDLDVLGFGPELDEVGVVWNEGERNFRSEQVWEAPVLLSHLDAADMDRDGDLDIALSLPSRRQDAMVLVPGSGRGHFEFPPFEGAEYDGVAVLAPGDFDGDGDTDLAAGVYEPTSLVIFTNDRGLRPFSVSVLGGTPTGLQAVDLEGDGDIDLALSANNAVRLYLNDDGRFESLLAGGPGFDVAASDLDGDGLADIAKSDPSGVQVIFHRAGRVFDEPQRYEFDAYTDSIDAADFDGDGRIDLIATAWEEERQGRIWVLSNTGSGSFAPSDYPMSKRVIDVNAADLDADGDTDAVVAQQFEKYIAVLDGRGDGTFDEPRSHYSGQLYTLSLHDIDADGDLDLLGALLYEEHAVLLFNNGAGSFTQPVAPFAGRISHLPVNGAVREAAAADFDGDGDADLALGRSKRGVLIIDNGMSPARRDCDGNGVPDSCDIAARLLPDRDGDGLADDCCGVLFTRGDADGNIEVNITDAVRILGWLFSGGEAPPCRSSADADDNATVDLTDPIYLLRFLFLSADPLPAPFPGCGKDPTLDDLACRSKTCSR